MRNKNSVSTIQKISVYIFLSTLIILFVFCRNNTINENILNKKTTALYISETLNTVIPSLYNYDNQEIISNYLNANYKENIYSYFEPAQKVLRDSNLHVSMPKLTINQIYKSTIKNLDTIICTSSAEFDVYDNNNNIIDSFSKDIVSYFEYKKDIRNSKIYQLNITSNDGNKQYTYN